MSKFYNLIYVNDLKAYEKGKGVPGHNNFTTMQLGTIIGYNESDTADKPRTCTSRSAATC